MTILLLRLLRPLLLRSAWSHLSYYVYTYIHTEETMASLFKAIYISLQLHSTHKLAFRPPLILSLHPQPIAPLVPSAARSLGERSTATFTNSNIVHCCPALGGLEEGKKQTLNQDKSKKMNFICKLMRLGFPGQLFPGLHWPWFKIR